MNILICDDIPEETTELDSILQRSGFKIFTTVFHNGYDALEYIHTGAVVDVCFLDVIMPKMNGIVLANEFRRDGFTGRIVFCTNSNEYAHESYRVNAFDYLLKPPTLESVNDVLVKLERAKNNTDTESILLKTAGVTKSVLLRDISYIEVINHKVYFRLTDRSEIEVYARFGDVTKRLFRDPRFLQCHRSYIVNMDDIAEISESETIMRTGARIPITRSFREARKIFYKRKFGGIENERTVKS